MSELLQSDQPVSGAETVSMEQFEDMLANPSMKAIERFSALRDDETHKWDIGEPVSIQISKYLRRQSYGYCEELLAAMHGSEEEFSDYLLGAFSNNPMLKYDNLNAFHTFIKPDDRAEIEDRAEQHPATMRDHFNEIIDDPTRAIDTSSYAEQALYSHGYRMDGDRFIRAVSEAKDMPWSERKDLVKNIIEGSYCWQQISIYSALSTENQRRDDCLAALDSLQDFINEGLTTPQHITASLDRMINPERTNMHADRREKQKKRKASKAKLLLTLEGILPTPEGQTRQDYVDNYVRNELASIQPELVDIAILAHSHTISEVEARRQLQEYDQRHHTARLEDFNRLFRRFNGQKFEYETFQHKNDELIDEWHQKYIVNQVSMRDVEKYRYHRTIKGYKGTQLDKITALVEKYHEHEELSLGQEIFAEYRAFFLGQEDRLRELIARKMTTASTIELPFDDWRSFAEFMDLSTAQIKQLARNEIEGNSRPGNAVHCIEDFLGHNDPLFTREESAELLRRRYENSEVDDYDQARLAAVCQHFLGRTITEAVLVPIMDESARAMLPNAMLGQAQALINKTDYYDVYKNAAKLNDFAGLLSQEQLAEFLDKAMNLADEHLADHLQVMWWYMSDEQQEAALSRLYKNPALAAIEAEVGSLQYFSHKKGHTRELQSAPNIDIMQQLAPKAYATYLRRLRSKTLPYDVQMSRPPEANLMPQALEGGRQNVLFTYAYFYDLCNRVSSFSDAEDVIPLLRGKKTEKNELLALETLVLLHEAAGFADLEKFKSLGREDIQRFAVGSVLHQYGLPDDKVSRLINTLEQDNVPLIKFGMWLHTSARSKKLKTYLGDFVAFIADGHDVSEWKLHHIKGNNLPDSLNQNAAELWVKNNVEEVNVGGIGPIRIQYTNDLGAIVNCGARPINNCLHYSAGINQHTLAGLLNADAKLINVENANGNPIANAVIRIATNVNTSQPLMTIEPIYTNESGQAKSELHRTILASAERYAASLGLELQIADVNRFGIDMYLAATAMWADTQTERGKAFIAESKAPFTYTDTAGASSKKTHMFTIARKKAARTLGTAALA